MLTQAGDVIRYWFESLRPAQWWKKSADLDEAIRTEFLDVLKAAGLCELSHWRNTLLGRLAEIIVLDQFSRHIYRGQPEAYAFDTQALCLSQEALGVLGSGPRASGEPNLTDQQYVFLVMPFMHSESKVIHQQAVKLYERRDLTSNLRYELRHKEIIDRFGRYPHRNAVLGRQSSPEEIAFLRQPGSSF